MTDEEVMTVLTSVLGALCMIHKVGLIPGAMSMPGIRGLAMAVYNTEAAGREIAAGMALRFPLPVVVPKNYYVVLKFYVKQEGMDIGFSIERKGNKPLVYHYLANNDVNKPCGPTRFLVEEASLLTFVWSNEHSW